MMGGLLAGLMSRRISGQPTKRRLYWTDENIEYSADMPSVPYSLDKDDDDDDDDLGCDAVVAAER